MPIKAIPTKYAGQQFRSRLEAKWAAFFDAVGWEWEYEPIDLNGYIPDFIVTPNAEPVLIEVKPLVEWPCAVPGCLCGSKDELLRSSYDDAVLKIQQSGWTKEALIVGASMRGSKQSEFSKIGQPVETVVGSGSWFDTGCVLVRCRSCDAKLLKPDVEGYGVGHSCNDRERPAIEIDPVPFWREAANRVQWRGAANSNRHVAFPSSDEIAQSDVEPDLSVWKFDPETDIA